LNENTNGLLQRFFPKGMKIGGPPKKDIEAAPLLIDIWPRKALNYLCPLGIVAGNCVSLVEGI